MFSIKFRKVSWSEASKEQAGVFLKALSHMRENRINTDVILECDGQEFHAHKVVLSTASPYFRNMFESSFQESATNRVKFPTVRSKVMDVLINFIYFTDVAFPTDYDLLQDLIKTSHLFEMKIFFEYCALKLLHLLNINTWLEVWNIGDLYDNPEIKDGVVTYVVKNLRDIVGQHEFLYLDLHKINAIVEKINYFDRPATDYMLKAIIEWVKYGDDREQHFAKICNHFHNKCFSSEYINYLIEEEKLVKENAEILLLFLKVQMQPKNKTLYTEKMKLLSDSYKMICFGTLDDKLILANEPQSRSVCHIFDLNGDRLSTKPLPFEISPNMTSFMFQSFVYFIGCQCFKMGDMQHSDKAGNVFIKYDVKLNWSCHKTPLLFTIHDNIVSAEFDNHLYVIGQREINVDKIMCDNIIQSYNSQTDQWTEINSFRNMNSKITCLKWEDRLLLFYINEYNNNVVQEIKSQYSFHERNNFRLPDFLFFPPHTTVIYNDIVYSINGDKIYIYYPINRTYRTREWKLDFEPHFLRNFTSNGNFIILGRIDRSSQTCSFLWYHPEDEEFGEKKSFFTEMHSMENVLVVSNDILKLND